MSDTLSSSWCRFVLNEGIMPASLARLIKNDDDNSNNPKLLAQILKTRESFSDSLYSELEQIAQTAFLNDEKLYNWLISMDNILNAIIAFSNDNNATKDALNGAFLSFIKSCPLVSDSIKAAYTSSSVILPTVTDVLRPNFYKCSLKNYSRSAIVSKKKRFIEYLDKHALKHYSKSTAQNYATSVNLGAKFIGKDLWGIDDPHELKEILNDLDMRDDYKEKNANTHNGLSSGMWRYLEFLEYNAGKK